MHPWRDWQEWADVYHLIFSGFSERQLNLLDLNIFEANAINL